MKRINGMCFVILSAFILSITLPPVVCFAQPENQEEEEMLQARPNPMKRPDPMGQTMRKPEEVMSLKLNDGRQLQQGMQGDKQVWFLVGAKSKKRTIANGAYTLQNGTQLNVQRGAMNPAQMRSLPQAR